MSTVAFHHRLILVTAQAAQQVSGKRYGAKCARLLLLRVWQEVEFIAATACAVAFLKSTSRLLDAAEKTLPYCCSIKPRRPFKAAGVLISLLNLTRAVRVSAAEVNDRKR